METRRVRFKVFRHRPGRGGHGRFQAFELPVGPRTTVLEALEEIRVHHDPSLLYRHSCHHASCGTCALRINGTERLACTTVVWSLDAQEVVLEPLAGLPRLGDLVVDTGPLHEKTPPGLLHLRESEWNPGATPPGGLTRYERFENCIECGACMSACPVSRGAREFVGPAGLAAISRGLETGALRAAEGLALAGGNSGAGRCERALHCSRVCPTDVYPAWHIHKLLERLRTEGES